MNNNQVTETISFNLWFMPFWLIGFSAGFIFEVIRFGFNSGKTYAQKD